MKKLTTITIGILICAIESGAQVTKLPTYAIQKIYQIDAVRDTIGFRNGGVPNGNLYEYIDSIVYRYNKKGQIDRETIWRFENFMPYGETDIENSNGFVLDTSRNFRQYYYDSKGREVAVHHGRIFGSPRRNNVNNYQPYPFGGPYYFEHLDRIDSTGYDSHDNLIFKRRYENLDFQNKNFTMVVKNCGYEVLKPLDIEYEYDDLGRIVHETRYRWNKGVRELALNLTAVFSYDFTYKYIGTSNKLQSRSYPFYAKNAPSIMKDSLFIYDDLGRISSVKTFGYLYDDGTKITPRYDGVGSTLDTIVYLDTYGSYQRKYYSNCNGEKYYEDGRLHFKYTGNIGNVILCFTGSNSTHEDTLLAKNNFHFEDGRVNHYYKDNEGNVLARDSSYLPCSYGSGSDSYQPRFNSYYFDTVAYYGLRPIVDIINGINYSQLIDQSLDVFPNPSTSGVLNVLSNQSGDVLLYNAMGELMGSFYLLSNQKLQINTADLPKGLYIIEQENNRKKVILN
jgi:hypothetical protein